MNTEFNDIAAYTPEQFGAALERIVTDKQFRQLLNYFCHEYLDDEKSADDVLQRISKSNTQDELDNNFTIFYLRSLATILCKNSLELRGAENLKFPAMLLSNHRDIILDAALLSVLIKDVTGKRIFFGAGTNLFVQSWVEDMIRINNGFNVIRGGGIHEMMNNSKHLSSYIRYLLTEQHAGVWLAQREGRAKDCDDRTQPAVLKMLSMSSDKDFISQAKEMNITPVSISYEYDPCDYLKAQELQLKRDNPNWKKSAKDDFESMQTGMTGYKGRTVFTITPSITPLLDEIDALPISKNEKIEKVAKLIDKQIHLNYCIYNVNRIAYDLYFDVDRFKEYYTKEDEEKFLSYLRTRLNKIHIENRDDAFICEKILEMYANPLINQLKAQSQEDI